MAGVSTLFEARSMIEAVSVRRPAKAFLRNLFFKNKKTFNTEAVDIDIVRAKQRAAAFVKLNQEGPVVERNGYSTRTYKPMILKPKMITTAEDAFRRQPGELLYSGDTGAQRAQEILSKDLMDLDDMISRREEIMCATALFSDVVQMLDNEGTTIAADISFGRQSSHDVSSGTWDSTYGGLWTDSDADPLMGLRLAKRRIAIDCGRVARVAIFSQECVDEFLAHPNVKDRLRDTKSDQVRIENQFPTFLNDGAVYVGNVEGLDIFEYVETYWDDWTDPSTPVIRNMVPANKILLGCTDARSEMLYGAIPHLKAGFAPVARFANSWEEEDPSARWLQLQSRPLPNPAEVDAFFVGQPIAS